MRVTLLAYTQLNPDAAALPASLGPTSSPTDDQAIADVPERLIEYAGRVCYRSTDKMGRNPRFVAARVKEGHQSIIEHVSFTFLVEGISRACSHQLVRHRLASYSQESQRYCELGSGDALVEPPAVGADPEAQDIWRRAVDDLAQAYFALRERSVRKEDARFLLPNAAATRIVVTMNARSLRHFFEVRLQPAAQWEIRDVAREMLGLVHSLAPSVFGDLFEAYGSDAAAA